MIPGYVGGIDAETFYKSPGIETHVGPRREIQEWVYSELESLESWGFMLVPVSDFTSSTHYIYQGNIAEYKMGLVRIPSSNPSLSPWDVAALKSRFARRLYPSPNDVLTLEITCNQGGSWMRFLDPDEDLEDALVGIGWKIFTNNRYQVLQPISVRKDLPFKMGGSI